MLSILDRSNNCNQIQSVIAIFHVLKWSYLDSNLTNIYVMVLQPQKLMFSAVEC